MCEKPNEFYVIMRCTTIKFARELRHKGSIKFNTPRTWVEEARKNGQGRGDMLEGVFAACSMLDIENVIAYSRQYSDVFGETIEGLTYFRRNRTMNLPCYCFFLLKQGLFELPTQEGKQLIMTNISGSYFRDFAGNISPEGVATLPKDDRPAVVFIPGEGMDKFLNMIIQKLMDLGLQRSEILFEIIEYVDKKTEFYCMGTSPRELKLKDQSFSHQAEGRIIVDTDKRHILEYLNQNPIELGSLKDICEISEDYHYEGVSVKLNADVYNIEE